MFKNIQLYRLPANWAMTAPTLSEALAAHKFAPCSSQDLLRLGWASPRADDNLVHAVGGQFLLCLKTEKKLLPAAVINQVAQAKAAELEEAQGFRPGRKAMKELKERVADELLPQAFSVASTRAVWIDPVNGWLVVDAASPTKADDVVKMLLKAVDRMPLESLRVQRSPVAVMTAWLEADEAPDGFTVDQDATMRATGESRAKVTYKHHTLEVADLRRHIAAGKQCERLAMTWRDKISFVLTEDLAIKSVKALDVLTESSGPARDEAERFDSDFALMSGELAHMLADLVEALGGYADGDAPVSRPADNGQHKMERAVGLTAEFYKVRALHRDVLNELYEATIEPAILRVREEMARSGEGAIKSALNLANALRSGSTSGQLLLVAAVEILEPSRLSAGDETLSAGGCADLLYDQAVQIVLKNQRASISLVQRHLRIGYNRAARLLDAMEKQGVIGAMQSNGNRSILSIRA